MPFFRKRRDSQKVRRRDIPDGMVLKCPTCSENIFKQELSDKNHVCSKCGYHFELDRHERLALLSDEGFVEEWDTELYSVDTLGFTGTESYTKKLDANVKKTGNRDAVSCGHVQMGGYDVGLGVMDFRFLGASMGSVVGEKITRLFERCTEEEWPVVLSCASGGARMYEGMLSLMQMAKTSAAISRHNQAGLPYISLLTHPTMAGVMASFATLGDVILAEPGALIGFAGPRVIKETTQQNLPDGFQTSEFLLKHGLLDMVVHRDELKETLVSLIEFMHPGTNGRPPADAEEAEPGEPVEQA